MRKFVLFMMLMLGIVSANAQWKVTPEAGMNVTKYKGENAKLGFKAGAAVSYTFESKWFSLQSGLYYVQRGKAQTSSTEIYGSWLGNDGKRYPANIHIYPPSGSYQGGWSLYGNGKGDGYSGGGYYGDLYQNGNLHDLEPLDFEIEGLRSYRNKEHRGYLQLPVLARFNWDMGRDVRLYLAAGPYFAFGITGVSKKTVVDERFGNLRPAETTERWNPFENQYWMAPRFDWGAALEVGVEVKRLTFKLGYDVGFGNNYRYDSFGPKYHTVSFTVGYTF